jgi:hypothetical protein
MNPRIKHLSGKLLHHPIYQQIKSKEDLRVFMENHVFAVWDFMCLLKTLQFHLTSVTFPWTPPEDPLSARLINEIVLCEESDVLQDGKAASHLDMYLEAMDEIGADTSSIRTFLEEVQLNNFAAKLESAQISEYVKKFVMYNLHLCLHGTVEEIASNFLYGREDSIPLMFSKILQQLNITQIEAPKFYHYLSRHIEVDSTEHSPAAFQLLERLIRNDKLARNRAERAAEIAVRARYALWDGLTNSILKSRETKQSAPTQRRNQQPSLCCVS